MLGTSNVQLSHEDSTHFMIKELTPLRNQPHNKINPSMIKLTP